MQILASFCNILAPGMPTLGLLNTATWVFQILELPAQVARCSGITGLAQCERYVYVAAQSSETLRRNTTYASSVLFIFKRHDFSLAGHYGFRSGADIHSLLGGVLCQAGRMEESIEHYRAALRIQPNSIQVYANLARGFAQANRSTEATATAEKT
jgi:tetratricopeptide (TPR) repeat protein